MDGRLAGMSEQGNVLVTCNLGARAFLIDSREPMSATAKKVKRMFLFASETDAISVAQLLRLRYCRHRLVYEV